VKTLHSDKEQLVALIAEKKLQLIAVSKAASSWNASRYKTKGYVQMSRAQVTTLQKEIKELQATLDEIDKSSNFLNAHD